MKPTDKLGLVLIGLAFSGAAFAGELHEEKSKRHGPPPVAIEACVGAVDGDACSFEGRRGNAVSGQCAIDKEEVLACRPDRGYDKLRRHDGKHETEGSEQDE